jgi:hypothetical protein
MNVVNSCLLSCCTEGLIIVEYVDFLYWEVTEHILSYSQDFLVSYEIYAEDQQDPWEKSLES